MKRNRAIRRGFHAPKAGALPGCATPRLGLHDDYSLAPLPRDLGGSIPLFLIAAFASSDARNAISRLDAAGSFEFATSAALKTEMYWISAGIVPTKSTPGACSSS